MDEKILSEYILDITTYNENGYIVKASLSPKNRKKQTRYLSRETETLFVSRQNYKGPNKSILEFMKSHIK